MRGGIAVGVVDRMVRRDAGQVAQAGLIEFAAQPAQQDAVEGEAFHAAPIALLVILHLRQGRSDRVPQIEDAEATITEARAGRIDMSEGRYRIGTAGDAEGDIGAAHELKSPGLVQQARVGSRLELMQRLEFFRISYIVEQGDGGILGVDQAVAGCGARGALGEVDLVHHIAAVSPSIRRNVSSSDAKLPSAMTFSGWRPLKKALSLGSLRKPYTLSGLSKISRNVPW